MFQSTGEGYVEGGNISFSSGKFIVATFFAHSMFLENESRIVAMVMIMGLVLMVYSIAERKLREALKKAGETILPCFTKAQRWCMCKIVLK